MSGGIGSATTAALLGKQPGTPISPADANPLITVPASWNSQSASGIEYAVTLDASDFLNNLVWSATPATQSILAVGCAWRINIRATHPEDDLGWAIVKQISLEGALPHPTSDSALDTGC